MKTSPRPELGEPVAAFAARLASGEREIPLADLAQLFGAPPEVRELVAGRGNVVFAEGGVFSNDGPELVVPAGSVELEVPSLMRGDWESAGPDFTLRFPMAEFAPRVCAQLALFRKCFELGRMSATGSEIVLDFGSELANRRYTF